MVSTKQINIDKNSHEQIALFLDGFFADYLKESEGYLALCSSGKRGWKQEFHTSTYLASHRAADLYLEGCDTYFCVNPVKSLSRKASAVQDILRLHVDADFKDAEGLNKLLNLKPSAVIASGTKYRYHGYWNFQAPINREVHAEDVKQMNRQLTRILGIKEEAFDISRALRVPGTANFKARRNPLPVGIVEWFPHRKYTLDQCAELLEINLRKDNTPQEPCIVPSDEPINGERGKYLSREERIYLERMLCEGLFESESRNKAMMLLIRYYYEQEFSKESIIQKVIEFFEQRNNGFSKEWIDSPKLVIAKIKCAVDNWFKKARPARSSLEASQLKRLSRRDEAFIQNQELRERDKLFLRDAMTWIVNNKRGDDLILSARQLMRFTNCNSKNYQLKRQILIKLGIVALSVEHFTEHRLANEYKVLHQFEAPLETRKGRKRKYEIDVKGEIDSLVLSGASNKTIRKRFSTVSRQRVYNCRKRFDYAAARSRVSLEV